MKRLILMAVAVALAGAAHATLTTTLTRRQTEDPGALRKVLNANFSEAETRIAAIEATAEGGTLEPGKILVGDATSNSVAVALSGDATIATTGALTIANAAVTLAKMANMATLSVIGRSTAATGVPEVLTAGTDHHVLRRSGSALGFGLLVNANIDAAAAIAHAKLAAVEPGYALIGNASSQAVAVAISGDVTMSNAGAVSLVAGTLTTNVIIDAVNTNTIVLRTLPGGAIVVNSWTQEAVGE
jgi:hypothetical protein